MILDFKNVISPNGSNPHSETSHFVWVVMLKKSYPLIYRHLFPNESLSEKYLFCSMASHDRPEVVVTWFGHYVKLA